MSAVPYISGSVFHFAVFSDIIGPTNWIKEPLIVWGKTEQSEKEQTPFSYTMLKQLFCLSPFKTILKLWISSLTFLTNLELFQILWTPLFSLSVLPDTVRVDIRLGELVEHMNKHLKFHRKVYIIIQILCSYISIFPNKLSLLLYHDVLHSDVICKRWQEQFWHPTLYGDIYQSANKYSKFRWTVS